jgi:hypothetical protein
MDKSEPLYARDDPKGVPSVSEFKVVNPATNETEREFAAATDAEIEKLIYTPAPR